MMNELPKYTAPQPLDDYLRQCMADTAVNKSALADALGLNRSGLYQILDGAKPTPRTLTRFGAFSGAINDTPQTRETLTMLGLLEFAEEGWRSRRTLSG